MAISISKQVRRAVLLRATSPLDLQANAGNPSPTCECAGECGYAAHTLDGCYMHHEDWYPSDYRGEAADPHGCDCCGHSEFTGRDVRCVVSVVQMDPNEVVADETNCKALCRKCAAEARDPVRLAKCREEKDSIRGQASLPLN